MSQVDLLLQRLSSWPHLLRMMSWVLHFIKRFRRETHNAVPVMTPTLSELQSASREVVLVVQRECFHEEYVALKGGGKVKSNSKLANLSPILVNDVIRVGGRIHRAPIAFEAAHPVVLPKSHPVSTLIVRYYHHILGHSVRGSPKKIWSDNGTNFTGAEKELSRSIQDLDDGTIRRELHRYETDWYRCAVPEWHFQAPTASHMSGVWERLIRKVRKAIKDVLGDRGAFSGRETLRTVFAEVMSILNSRPMCPASDDPNDMEALTPNHLLLQRRNLVVPPGVFTKEELYTRKQWRYVQFLADCFWSRWLREYVPTLQHRHKWLLKKRNLVNDLVLIVDNSVPRCLWMLGRVTKVFPGQDAFVRTAKVMTKNSVLVRPVTKLCLFEEAP
ncbi:uncharacterized protein [Montipora foliosa]|uniref:uncharacterized protein n=1 Tax=Montipora foliosa TaxID=591990 RepID=UPI0035F1AE70